MTLMMTAGMRELHILNAEPLEIWNKLLRSELKGILSEAINSQVTLGATYTKIRIFLVDASCPFVELHIFIMSPPAFPLVLPYQIN